MGSTLDRGTSALASLVYGRPPYGVEKSALWERLLLVGIVGLLLTLGWLAGGR